MPILRIAYLGALLASTALPALAQPAKAGSWLSSGNGPANSASTKTETALSRSTVGGLVPIWTLKTMGEVSGTPTVDAGRVYATDDGGSVYCVDAATGIVVWHVMLPQLTGISMSTSRNAPAIGPTQIVLGDQAAGNLYALSKADGKLLWTAKLDTHTGAIITSSPLIFGERVIVGVSSMQEELAATTKGFVPSFRGSVAEVSLRTGEILWQTYTVPQGYTGGAVWGSNLGIDVKRRAVFAGTGDNYSVPASVAACQARAPDTGALAACAAPNDYFDSVMSLDLFTGKINWVERSQALDTWTVSCLTSSQPPATPCPEPHGPDYDFGSAPNLFSADIGGKLVDLVGAGQKSGVYWAFNRDNGAIVWGTQVSPGGSRGGIEWGSAVDGGRIFVAASNSAYTYTSVLGHAETDGGYWSALDAATGRVLWQTPTTAKQAKIATASSRTQKAPAGAKARAEGAISSANGVLYAADASGNFVALDELSGKLLWTYAAGGAAVDAPSIVNGVLYWGDGYGNIGPTNKAIYAFGLKK